MKRQIRYSGLLIKSVRASWTTCSILIKFLVNFSFSRRSRDQWTKQPVDTLSKLEKLKPGFDIVTVEELIEIDVDHRVKKPEDRLHV